MTSQPQTPRPSGLARIPASWWISLLLVLGVIVVYWPAFGYRFLHYDDQNYVWQNPPVIAGLTWRGVVWAFTTFHAANWHPLTWLSLMLDAQLFGVHAGAYHTVNVLFHAANTVLLFWWLRGMMGLRQEAPGQPRDTTLSDANKTSKGILKATASQAGATWRSAMVAALFGIHPLHVESVAWIAERKDVLSTFFFMLTLMAYTKYVQASRLRRPRPRVLYGLALLFFVLGLMSKPMLVTLPFVLLLLDFWPLKRVTSDKWQVTGTKTTNARPLLSLVTRHAPLLLEKLPFFALSAASSVVTFLAQQGGKTVMPLMAMPMGVRIQNAFVSYAAYLGKMLWPGQLAAFYPLLPIKTNLVVTAVFVLALISLAVFVLGRQRPYLAIGWLWYLGTLVPVIGLVQVGGQSMADRYTYIPLIGIFVALIWGVGDLWPGWRYRRIAFTVVSVAVLGVCLRLSAVQVRYWQNDETLARHSLAVTGDNAQMEVVRGRGLIDQGNIDAAALHFAKAVRLSPGFLPALDDMALVHFTQGKLEEAIADCHAALRIHPREPQIHFILANIYAKQGKPTEAVAEYKAILQPGPNHNYDLNNRAWHLATAPDTPPNIRAFNCAYLAWLMATSPDARLRNGADAVEFATQACQLTHYKITMYVGTLAAAYAEAGRFDDAVKTAEQTIALATAQKQNVLAAMNRELLKLYRAHKAFHRAPEH